MQCRKRAALAQDSDSCYGQLDMGSKRCNADVISDAKSPFSSRRNLEKVVFHGSDYIKLDKEMEVYGIIENLFLWHMLRFGLNVRVFAIHKNACSSYFWQGRLKTFQMVHEQLGNGNPNLKCGWFTASKSEIDTIFSNGFQKTDTKVGIYGRGVFLSPLEFPIDRLQSSVDEDGMRYLVLCRVIMGRTELVCPGSKQCCPSCEDFDSGVDDLVCPKKYILWGGLLNTRIIPDFVITIKTPSILHNDTVSFPPMNEPSLPLCPFAALMAVVSKLLPEDKTKLIETHLSNFKDKEITREEFMRRVGSIVGDEVVVTAIQAFKDKRTSKRKKNVYCLELGHRYWPCNRR